LQQFKDGTRVTRFTGGNVILTDADGARVSNLLPTTLGIVNDGNADVGVQRLLLPLTTAAVLRCRANSTPMEPCSRPSQTVSDPWRAAQRVWGGRRGVGASRESCDG